MPISDSVKQARRQSARLSISACENLLISPRQPANPSSHRSVDPSIYESANWSKRPPDKPLICQSVRRQSVKMQGCQFAHRPIRQSARLSFCASSNPPGRRCRNLSACQPVNPSNARSVNLPTRQSFNPSGRQYVNASGCRCARLSVCQSVKPCASPSVHRSFRQLAGAHSCDGVDPPIRPGANPTKCHRDDPPTRHAATLSISPSEIRHPGRASICRCVDRLILRSVNL